MITTKTAIVALLTLVLIIAACGDGDDEAAPSDATAAPGVQPTAAATVTPPPAPSIPAVVPTPTAAPAAATAPTATATAAPTGSGVLDVRVTDAPPEGVTKVLVTVDNIQVHQAGAQEENGWLTVIEEEKTFDLVAVTGIEEVLDTKEFAVGKYTQVRLNVISVTVTIEV